MNPVPSATGRFPGPGWRQIRRQLTAAWLLVTLTAGAVAQVLPAAPELAGTTLDGQPYDLSRQQGRVRLVMFWSTGCAVCRDKMPELRRNIEGWRGQPFELVSVNLDSRLDDLHQYEELIRRTTPVSQRFATLWAGASGFRSGFGRPAQLPAAWLIDKQGRVVAQWQGRIPPEAWDRIAELL